MSNLRLRLAIYAVSPIFVNALTAVMVWNDILPAIGVDVRDINYFIGVLIAFSFNMLFIKQTKVKNYVEAIDVLLGRLINSICVLFIVFIIINFVL